MVEAQKRVEELQRAFVARDTAENVGDALEAALKPHLRKAHCIDGKCRWKWLMTTTSTMQPAEHNSSWAHRARLELPFDKLDVDTDVIYFKRVVTTYGRPDEDPDRSMPDNRLVGILVPHCQPETLSPPSGASEDENTLEDVRGESCIPPRGGQVAPLPLKRVRFCDITEEATEIVRAISWDVAWQ